VGVFERFVVQESSGGKEVDRSNIERHKDWVSMRRQAIKR
jgi:hypothetical protein